MGGVWVGVLASVMVAAASAAGSAAAEADTQPGVLAEVAPAGAGLSLTPRGQSGSFFSVTQSPGSIRTYTVGMVNAGSADTAYSTYAADAYTLPGGGLGARPGGHERTGTTTWLVYSAQSGFLAAGQTEDRTFTVRVPERTDAGQYVTSLAIENTVPDVVGSASGVSQILRNVIAVSIRVPGTLVPAFTTGQATATEVSGQWQVSIPLRNTGNVVVKPAGRVRVVDGNDHTIHSEKLAMGSVFAGTSTTIDLAVDQPLPEGHYKIVFDLTDSTSGVALSENVSAFVVGNPPSEKAARTKRIIIFLSLLITISLSVGIIYLFRIRRRSVTNTFREQEHN